MQVIVRCVGFAALYGVATYFFMRWYLARLG